MRLSTPKLLMSLAVLALAGQSYAGGIYLYETGTEDVGLANAGVAARAQDASTVVSNPAGMTQLSGNQMLLAGQMLYGDLPYTPERPNLKGSDPVVGWLPGGSAYYSHSLSNDLKLGVGFYGNFGLSLDFDSDWAGRTLVKQATMMGLTLQPAVGYRVNDKVSLGAGLGINYGIFELTRDNFVGGGESSQKDHDWATNLRLGATFAPASATRLGVTYASKVDYKFAVDKTGSVPITGNSWSLPVGLGVAAPQQLMFSGVQRIDSKLSLLGNIGWQDWSQFSDMDINAGNVSGSSPLQLQDSWHFAVGAQYQLQPATRLNAGIAFDNSMYKDNNQISLTMPTADSWRFGVGIQQQLDNKASLGASFEYLDSKNACAQSPAILAGCYNNPKMYFMAVNYGYRF